MKRFSFQTASKLACMLVACVAILATTATAQTQPPASPSTSAPAPSATSATQAADPYVHVPLNISFVPGIGIGSFIGAGSGKKVAQVLSYNILVGVADRLEGVEWSGVWGHYHDDSFGVQGAGVGNSIGGSFEGVQGAGVVNIIDDHFKGAQGAGVVNIVGKSFDGVQSAGVVNIVGKSFDGVQSAGVLNITGSTTSGIQAAGVGNITHGAMNGLQAAGIFNTAGAMNGFHCALFNFADSGTGIPIGLFSLVKNVGIETEVWGDDMGFAHLTLRTGTRNFANYLGVFGRPASGNTFANSGILYGLGFENDLGGNFYSTIDLMGMTIGNWSQDQPQFNSGSYSRWFTVSSITKLRATVGLEVFNGFRIFGGVALNWFTSWNGDSGSDYIRWSVFDAQIGNSIHRIAPGLVFGVHLF